MTRFWQSLRQAQAIFLARRFLQSSRPSPTPASASPPPGPGSANAPRAVIRRTNSASPRFPLPPLRGKCPPRSPHRSPRALVTVAPADIRTMRYKAILRLKIMLGHTSDTGLRAGAVCRNAGRRRFRSGRRGGPGEESPPPQSRRETAESLPAPMLRPVTFSRTSKCPSGRSGIGYCPPGAEDPVSSVL